MKRFILTVIFAVSTAQAEWTPNNEADVVLDYSNATFTVKADGSYVMEEERKFTAKNETGRNKLALEKVQFIPEITSIQIMRATSMTEGNESIVNLKTITERTAAGPESGISGTKELIIPFTNLKIGSSIKYKVLSKNKAIHPGIFSMSFVYGSMFPEMNGDVKIRSEKKLIWASSDKKDFIKVTEGKDGKYFTLNIKMLKPMDKTLKGESLAILNHDTYPLVQVTTLENWNTFAKMISGKYEAALNQELPPVFQTIVAKASAKTNIYDKIDVVTSELATIMTYSGNWTTADKMFYPRGHKEVATSKTGDCKDFATSTAGMLRKMGINATVALVNRKQPFSPSMKIQSTPMKAGFAFPIFNHAIVRVESPDKKVFWVDPTNPVSNSRVPGMDIAESATLNLSANAIDLEIIPTSAAEESVIKYDKKIRIMPDETAETDGNISLTGLYAVAIKQESFMDNKKKADESLLRLFGSTSSNGVQANYSSRIAGLIEGKIKTFGEKIYSEKDQKNYLLVPVPMQLQIIFAGAGYNRVTDLYLGPKGKITNLIKVEGYDFNQDLSHGCLALSPYVDFERKIFKVEGGFEIRDTATFKKEMVSASEMNDQEFKGIMGDVSSCVSSQAIVINKIDPNTNLKQRLASYTMAEIQKLRDKPGAESLGQIPKIKLIADQILSTDPNNLDAIVEVIRTTKSLGYRYGELYGPVFLEQADKLTDEALLAFPDHPKLLTQKTFNMARMNRIDEAKKYFSKTFYATKDKDFDFYQMGAFMGEKMKDKKVEKQSHLKSLEVAKTNADKSSAYRSLGQLSAAEGNVKQAEEYYGYALQFEPKDNWLMNDMVILAMNNKEYQKAIDIGEKMLVVGEFGAGKRNLATSYGRLAGEIFRQRSRPNAEKAQLLAMKGLKYDSSSEDCLTTMGYIASYLAQELQDPVLVDRAISIWEKLAQVAESKRTSQFALTQLGFAYTMKQNIEVSSKNAEKLVMKMPPPPTPATRAPASATPTATAAVKKVPPQTAAPAQVPPPSSATAPVAVPAPVPVTAADQ